MDRNVTGVKLLRTLAYTTGQFQTVLNKDFVSSSKYENINFSIAMKLFSGDKYEVFVFL